MDKENLLRTVRRLIASSENPAQAVIRATELLQSELPGCRFAGVYVADGGRLLPGPGMNSSRGEDYAGPGPLREVAQRAAVSGHPEVRAGQDSREVGVPLSTESEITGALVISLEPARDLDSDELELLQKTAAALAPLV